MVSWSQWWPSGHRDFMVISVKRCCCTVKCLLWGLKRQSVHHFLPWSLQLLFPFVALGEFCFLSAQASSNNDLVTNNTRVSFGTKPVEALAWKASIPSQGIAALRFPPKFLLSVTEMVLKLLSSVCNKFLSREKDRIWTNAELREWRGFFGSEL